MTGVTARRAPTDRAVAFLQSFNAKARRERVPLSGSIELTRRCNLRCIHCYVGGAARGGALELGTGAVLALIDEACAAGCLHLLITGGEPLLREDFAEVYRHAKLRGLLVTVFTNGTLIDEPTLDLFAELPPHLVEVSLYGASPRTCERITGVAGSCERCLRGVRGLLARKVRVGLKTVLMTENLGELDAIRKIADDLGVRFRFDAEIFPRLDGAADPLRLRVPPARVPREELRERGKRRQWVRHFERTRGAPVTDSLYACGAGVTGFHVSAAGTLQPCLMVGRIGHDLSAGGFGVGWREVVGRISEQKVGGESACPGCEKRHLCGYCPGLFALESGSERVRSAYVCAIGEERYRILAGQVQAGVRDEE